MNEYVKIEDMEIIIAASGIILSVLALWWSNSLNV